ncbi:MAG TPA: alpha/beta fold hydrolase [Streptosporangiaceae bacterium]|nr:alpha/beta fold hydrolase [Streptosporangiaceae bacterium]
MKRIRLAVAAAGVIAAVIPLTISAASAAPAALSRRGVPSVPKLAWRACHGGFQCSTARVPLDYRRPGGSKISLALIRHLATASPARRLGTMFLNFGGPMEQFEPFLSGFSAIPAALRDRYDIVAFDPRGFGFSTSIRCFSSVAAENKFLAGLPPFPVGARQDAAWERTWARFDALCARRNGSLLDHVATADTARDLNLLRQAVGARKLNYLGASYGSVLGAVYANLFPATTGHLVLDGSFDPVAWSRGTLPASLRLGQDLATSAALRSYLELCGQAPASACAFSAGTPSATEAKFARLEQIVRRHPVMFGNPPQPITLAKLLLALPLGDVDQWQGSTALLQQFWLAATSSSGSAGARSFWRPAHAAASGAPYTGLEQTYAVSCADEADPRNVGAYSAAARLAQARAGGYGLYFTWTDEPCAHWPGTGAEDKYSGPWNRPTASTILVLSLTGDPLTSNQDAIAMSRDLARARLLTVAGWGHTELANPSNCAIRYEVSYLTTGALPPDGTVCAQNVAPFPVPSSG